MNSKLIDSHGVVEGERRRLLEGRRRGGGGGGTFGRAGGVGRDPFISSVLLKLRAAFHSQTACKAFIRRFVGRFRSSKICITKICTTTLLAEEQIYVVQFTSFRCLEEYTGEMHTVRTPQTLHGTLHLPSDSSLCTTQALLN